MYGPDSKFSFARRALSGRVPRYAALTVACVVLGACGHLGPPLEQAAAAPGVPGVDEILSSIAANDRQLDGFRAAGTFSLESPERPGVDRFGQSTVLFRKPGNLHVVGRKLAFPTPLFRLTCVGEEYLIEFPTEKQYHYEVKAKRFGSVPFPVSPSDVVREMFFSEDWDALGTRHVRLVSYDAGTRTAQLEVMDSGLRRRVRRRLEVTGVPWVVTRSALLDKSGNTIAVTSKSGYRDVDGVRFPARVEAEFPGENTRMTLDLRSVKLNPPFARADFDIEEIKRRLDEIGHQAVSAEETRQP